MTRHAHAVIAAAAVAALMLPVISASATNIGGNNNAKILLHLVPKTGPSAPACASSALPNCGGIATHGDPFPSVYYACVFVTDVNPDSGVAGIQFGIEYGPSGVAADGIGVDVWQWQLCGTMEFLPASPPWPSSGSYNMIMWEPCQRTVPPGSPGVVANAGYFYLASYGNATMRVTERLLDGVARVANCALAENLIEGEVCGSTGCDSVHHDPSFLGSIGFGTEPGWNPCGLVDVAVESVTWGKVKSLYRE